nr:FemAB family [uncultured bacterium]
MTWQAGIPDTKWDKQLFAAGGHFIQSSHWAAVQVALGNKVFYAHSDGWQALAVVEYGKLGGRLYCPYGPTAATPAVLTASLQALKQLAKQQGVAYVRIEPQGPFSPKQLQNHSLHPAPRDTQPRFTWVKNLHQPDTQIMAEMTSTNRNLYNTAAKKGITFKESRTVGDLSIFLDMIHGVAKNTGIKPHTDREFQVIADTLIPRNAAKLYFALHNKKPIASALVYDSPTTRYYAHAASYSAARKLQAASPLLTRMILDAKQQSQNQFDFFGIAPPNNPTHQWIGFSNFKKSFGGELKEYLGSWELPIKPVLYAAYRLAHTVKRFLP